VQGLFGKYTVTLKLYPAIVTLHLLGGLVLLACWRCSTSLQSGRPLAAAGRCGGWRLGGAGVLVVQIALGGWVSTNYAVLACSGFPQVQRQWWPKADGRQGFTCCASWATRVRRTACLSMRWWPSTGRTVSFARAGCCALVLLALAASRGRAPVRSTWGPGACCCWPVATQRPVERGAGLADRRGPGCTAPVPPRWCST
jgi:heme A synthase